MQADPISLCCPATDDKFIHMLTLRSYSQISVETSHRLSVAPGKDFSPCTVRRRLAEVNLHCGELTSDHLITAGLRTGRLMQTAIPSTFVENKLSCLKSIGPLFCFLAHSLNGEDAGVRVRRRPGEQYAWRKTAERLQFGGDELLDVLR